MTPERLEELRSKVKHGFNLINSEAREVFEHFGESIDPRKRCEDCAGVGEVWGIGGYMRCPSCNGTRYEVNHG